MSKWTQFIKKHKPQWTPKQWSRICSNHFVTEDFDHTGQTTCLHKKAVPSVYDPDVSHLPSVTRRVLLEHNYLSKNKHQHTASYQYIPEHNYCATQSPRTVSRRMATNNEHIARQRKRMKILQQRVRRMKKKVHSMNDLIKELRSKFKLTDNATDILTVSGSAITNDLLDRISKQQTASRLTKRKYTAALRQFSLTLNFYSAKAYQYVRNTFNLALPHPSVLQSWYRSINGEPGFTEEAFTVLQHHVSHQSPKPVICNLTLDEMAIRKQIEWDGKQFRGYVDIGTGVQDDTLPPATEALVFMVVALNANWKLPVGYFLLNGVNGTDKANLIKQCISRLHDLHIITTSVTCDGASSNLAMFRELGASMNTDDLQPWFKHPNHEQKIQIILDICHMLKLLRNTFASQNMTD